MDKDYLIDIEKDREKEAEKEAEKDKKQDRDITAMEVERQKKLASEKATDFTEGVNFSNEEEVLRVALKNEINGRLLYVQYANTVRNPMAKRVFIYLANEELKHIEDIKKFLSSMKKKVEADLEGMIEKGSAEKTKVFFGKMLKEFEGIVRPGDDDNQSRQVAMDIEKAGYEYYKKGAGSTSNEKLKTFFEWLTEQEQAHFMLIRNSFEYANSPDSWFAEEEHWLLEG
jgi:rubrerythrin